MSLSASLRVPLVPIDDVELLDTVIGGADTDFELHTPETR